MVVKTNDEGSTSTTQTRGEDLLFAFLSEVFDKDQELIDNHLENFFVEVVKNKVFHPTAIAKGLSRYLWGMGDLVCDVPRLPLMFTMFVLTPIFNAGDLVLKSLVWVNPEMPADDMEYAQWEALYVVGSEILGLLLEKHAKNEAVKLFKEEVSGNFAKFHKWANEENVKELFGNLSIEPKDQAMKLLGFN